MIILSENMNNVDMKLRKNIDINVNNIRVFVWM